MSWLQDLQAGDGVVLCSVGGRRKTCGTVSRVTSRSVYAGGQRYSKATGLGWGQPHISIEEMTDAAAAAVQAQSDDREADCTLQALLRAAHPGAALPHLKAALAALED